MAVFQDITLGWDGKTYVIPANQVLPALARVEASAPFDGDTSLTRPTPRHANVIKSRARFGHNEDQLARGIGVTRETMRKWAKSDRDFAIALDEALQVSLEYWERVADEVQRRDWGESHKIGWTLLREERERKAASVNKRKPVSKRKPTPTITKEQLQREREHDDAAWGNVIGA